LSDVRLDLSTPGRFHVVGVGGPGMSAIALVLAEMGHQVSGSDLRELPVLERLRAAEVEVNVGHDRAVVHGAQAVTASTAIPSDNIELDEARRTGVPVLRRADMLAAICAQASSIGVAGTHGKTTTTSMLSLALVEAGLRPGFIVGGDITDVGTGAHWSGGDFLVVEADESDGTHLALPLHGTILTNVDVDHLDHFGTVEALEESFVSYLEGISGPRVVCFDDVAAARAGAIDGVIGYGAVEDDAADHPRWPHGPSWWARELRAKGGVYTFTAHHRPDPEAEPRAVGQVSLPLRGVHNVRNACGVIAMATALGAPFERVVAALARFGGVARRFDIRGEHRGATLVDDYAHLPAEIDAVLRAARTSGDSWQRVVAVFQPNRFHRMAVMSPAYADAFTAADLVVITDIYASGTTPIPGVTGKLVVNAVCEAHPEQRVVWMPRRGDLVEYLARELGAGDLCISMGCGDVADLPTEVLDRRRALEALR
jgi:UDP-N-acetylmuramate--alanine ligase